ncbi:MAG: hypothetical protein K1Y36_19705 [Blastocatellia bacterium]|nr:hypothetical protein [Blastocatellia bacterium]
MKSTPKPPRRPRKPSPQSDNLPPFVKTFVMGARPDGTPILHTPEQMRAFLAQKTGDGEMTLAELTALNTLGELCGDLYDIQELTRRFHEIGASYQKNNQLVKALAIFKKIAKLDPSDIVAAQKCKEILDTLGIKS